VSSPANLRNLEQYRQTVRRLALARGVDSTDARRLARTGKAVVWIDGGLHANEVLGAQQLMETLYQLVSRNDAETMRILDDVIVLFIHANPDGMDLVSDWYMRNPNPQQRSTANIPRLYQKYIGHDNNRDFYASTQPETENMNRVMYHTWFPQIVYNHHQTGPTGTVMFAPPFRDPFNYVYDPLVVTELDQVGAAMHARFIAEDKPGVTTRRGANYSTWWNGGLRTTAYFHNMIGLLTETIGNPTPMDIPFLANRQLPSGDLVSPIAPQRWHFRQSVDYSVTANYAVLDMASRYRETLLMNQWRMGMNSIQRGSRDSWTPYPRRIDAARDSIRAAGRRRTDADGVMTRAGWWRRARTRRSRSATWRCCAAPSGATRAATCCRRPAGLRHRHQVRQRAAGDGRGGAPRHRAVRRGGQAVPGGLVRGDGGAALPPARAGHVRAAGPPQRLPLRGRPADPAVRQRRVDAGVPDGREVRPHPGGFTGPFQRLEAFNTRPAPGRVSAPRYTPGGVPVLRRRRTTPSRW
jgi:hypothetical protein